MNFTSKLALWSTGPVNFSEAAQRSAEDALFDITACIIGGAREESTAAMLSVASASGPGSAFAIGMMPRLSAPWAALVRATAAHALDFDDNFAPSATHATAVLAPALFAIADEEGYSGHDVLEAYAVGLEAQARLGLLVNPGHYERGWHATSTIGAIGSAVGCARLLGLDAPGTIAAISIASSMASGSKKQFGSMMKPVHAGLAAKAAVLSARMAQAGVRGDDEPVVGCWGFADLYDAGAPDDDDQANSALGRLGECLAIESIGLLVKRFPCCGAAHRTLDGLAELHERYSLTLDRIDRVEVHVPAFARDNLRFDDPRDGNEARFSLPYCAARVLQQGQLTLEDLAPDRVTDPGIRGWMERISVIVKPGSVSDELGDGAAPATSRVVTVDGHIHEAHISVPRGSRLRPLGATERHRKFEDCCRWAGASDTSRLLDLTGKIGGLPHFSTYSEALAKACPPT